MTASSIVKCFIPVIWLVFSLTYSRSDYRDFLSRWRRRVGRSSVCLPAALSFVFRDQLVHFAPVDASGNVWRLQFGPMANVLNAILLVALALDPDEPGADVSIGRRNDALADQVCGAGPGRDFWRPALRQQPGHPLLRAGPSRCGALSPARLLIGCLFLTLAYARTGWREIDVHPSTAVLRSSLTVVLVGGYLFIVGALALVVQPIRRRRVVSASGVCGAAGDGRPGRAALVRPRPAGDSSVRRPAFQEGAARFGAYLDAVLAKPGQGQRAGPSVHASRQS